MPELGIDKTKTALVVIEPAEGNNRTGYKALFSTGSYKKYCTARECIP
jgi:hypothetical protein